jgi:hypothetical protein
MNPRHAFVLIASLSVAAACAEPPVAPSADGPLPSFAKGGRPYEPGEQQGIVDLTRATLAIYPAGQGQILAQTFTPSSNQWLGYLELPVGCAANVLLNVKIRRRIGGRVLYEANIAGLPAVVDGTFQLLQVFDPATSRNGIKLHKNRHYSFELSAFPAPGATETTCGIAQGPAANSYAGGRGYFQDPVNGPTFLPLPNGASTDDQDLPFITLVR